MLIIVSQTMIIISVVVGVLTAPVNFIVDFLCVDVLSAPMPVYDATARRSSVAQRAVAMGRRASAAVMAVSDAAISKLKLRRDLSTTRMKIPRGTMDAHLQLQSVAFQPNDVLETRDRKRATLIRSVSKIAPSQVDDPSYDEFLIEFREQRSVLSSVVVQDYDSSWR